jgi:hypothetical protein
MRPICLPVCRLPSKTGAVRRDGYGLDHELMVTRGQLSWGRQTQGGSDENQKCRACVKSHDGLQKSHRRKTYHVATGFRCLSGGTLTQYPQRTGRSSSWTESRRYDFRWVILIDLTASFPKSRRRLTSHTPRPLGLIRRSPDTSCWTSGHLEDSQFRIRARNPIRRRFGCSSR